MKQNFEKFETGSTLLKPEVYLEFTIESFLPKFRDKFTFLPEIRSVAKIIFLNILNMSTANL